MMDNNLNPNKIVDTIHLLHKRIHERFPKAGLVNVCMQLHHIAKDSQSRCHWIASYPTSSWRGGAYCSDPAPRYVWDWAIRDVFVSRY